jgi:GTP 3',8-cyclase
VRPPTDDAERPSTTAQVDRLGRALRELRVSVTDRCNFRCGYCMPADVYHDGYRFMRRDEILSFEEIARAVRVAVQRIGVEKIRLTGGEPLVRRDLPALVRMLSAIDGLSDLTLTTNGLLLAEHAQALARAGLRRVTVSLDALDAETFRRMSGVPSATPERVLEGIEAAREAGLSPIKINCVVIRGVNEHAIEALARQFRGTGHVVRFIEFMDVGTLNAWDRARVVPGDEILAHIGRVAPLEPVAPSAPGHVAERYRYADGGGEVGVIASVSRPFCGDCTRGRLSADGRLLTCLFASAGFDLRAVLRSSAPDEVLAEAITRVWTNRSDRYSELRSALGSTGGKRRLEMFQIGG